MRGTCRRVAAECKFAHPTVHEVAVDGDGHLLVCADMLVGTGTCNALPPQWCHFYHPPAHILAQVCYSSYSCTLAFGVPCFENDLGVHRD